MQLDFAFLCARATEDDNLTASGIGLESFSSRAVPFVIAEFYCVAQVVTEDIAETRMPLAVGLRLFDRHRVEYGKFTTDMEPMVWSEDDRSGSARLVIGLLGTTIHHFGLYSVHLVVNGVELKQFRLRAIRPERP